MPYNVIETVDKHTPQVEYLIEEQEQLLSKTYSPETTVVCGDHMHETTAHPPGSAAAVAIVVKTPSNHESSDSSSSVSKVDLLEHPQIATFLADDCSGAGSNAGDLVPPTITFTSSFDNVVNDTKQETAAASTIAAEVSTLENPFTFSSTTLGEGNNSSLFSLHLNFSIIPFDVLC